ncbi:Transcriptional regulatory protein WalR [Pedobacter sp. Bi27]|jgi:DNA-binding response OmpR family regulator|uniref:response regulator n=1 Tax=unclassified Pedobacter TaxID=2628915 RepID=UPI001DEB6E5A|nr:MULTISPECIES: response regulator [unclassified Pedobacter]CAH0276295.1 Transcriptional regulatory protein WalR [Pedobacter sp. Bi36]CAH0295687.1 Transcriptional regulatory protein WalR [Pedobacter sp. Bi126]CAH0311559.1 Transcriptional regulatory protein WalR [Pedobacter sp. Bi27]
MPKKIILIEDDPSNLDALTLALTCNHYQVFGFLNGRQMIENIRSIIPDMIIIDIMLGYEDGKKLCSMIRETPDISHLPVILTSANGNISVIRDCQADAFIEKPFDINEMYRLIESHMLIM